VAAAAAAAAAAGFAAGDPEHMSRSQRLSELRLLAKYKPALVRRLKRLFDALDTECTGSVETLELNAELRLLELPVQVTLNFSQRAHTSFAQLLEAVFPHSTPSEREEITRWVCRRPVTRELVAKIKQLFDALDTTFCGHVRLSRIVPLLARSQHLAEFVSVAPVRSAELFRSVTLPQLLERLFAHSHHHQLAEIRRWGAPSATLSGEQLHELEELFMHYDRDNSGTITMGELRLAFQAMGFAEETYRDLFRLYDTNGDKEINLFEFQAFYREVWGARDALAAAAAPPQTLEQLPQLQQLDTP
jgi:Ca2+-binding EF-hand superfamily protein